MGYYFGLKFLESFWWKWKYALETERNVHPTSSLSPTTNLGCICSCWWAWCCPALHYLASSCLCSSTSFAAWRGNLGISQASRHPHLVSGAHHYQWPINNQRPRQLRLTRWTCPLTLRTSWPSSAPRWLSSNSSSSSRSRDSQGQPLMTLPYRQKHEDDFCKQFYFI